jgi:hypothetical protein
LIYNNFPYHNGDHGIDALASAGSRIIANSVYDNVTAGSNLEGGSTGGRLRTTSVSTMALRVRARRAISASTAIRPPERPSTTTPFSQQPRTPC